MNCKHLVVEGYIDSNMVEKIGIDGAVAQLQEGMVRQIADALIKSKVGKLETEYDVQRQRHRYHYSIRVIEE